jgi:ketol-acid reductoisomerase
VDLMYQGGMSYMWYSVSETAEHGGYTAGDRIITEETKAEMWRMLEDIQTGRYAEQWIAENQAGKPEFNKMRETEQELTIEKVGLELRRMMPFLDAKEIKAGE